jgi:hypothetical protein
MVGHKERWLELCELAEIEQDSGKLMAFVDEINRLLEEEQLRKSAIEHSEVGIHLVVM